MIFAPLKHSDIPKLQPFLLNHPFRSCDFTVGGIFLWAGAFNYQYAICDNTLFISGTAVNDSSLPAFSLPLGPLPLSHSIKILLNHCAQTGIPLTLSSVPEEALPVLIEHGARQVEQLPDWSDYIYSASSLASFSGKKLMKKRNHLNRFAADHPDAQLLPITPDDTPALINFYTRLESSHTSPIALYDRQMTLQTLRSLPDFPFEGAILSVPSIGIVGFTLGEIVGDTLHVHIEKMDHSITGAGETLCNRFASMMLSRHPNIQLINRQDDSGDQGLRRAKLALHPLFLLHKYNVTF